MEAGKGLSTVQAGFRIIIWSATFLKTFSIKIHMPGHFAPLDVVFSYPESPLARGSYSSWLYFLILTVLYLHADKSPTLNILG